MLKGILIAGFFLTIIVAPTKIIIEHQENKEGNPYYYRSCPAYSFVTSFL